MIFSCSATHRPVFSILALSAVSFRNALSNLRCHHRLKHIKPSVRFFYKKYTNYLIMICLHYITNMFDTCFIFQFLSTSLGEQIIAAFYEFAGYEVFSKILKLNLTIKPSYLNLPFFVYQIAPNHIVTENH